MPKMSKTDWKKQGAEVKAQFADAKKKQQNFALLFAKEGMVLETDPRLPAENVKKKAKKKDGATAKGILGTLKVQGTKIEFRCAEEPPGGTETRIKQWLSLMGLKLKPILILPGEEDANAKAKGSSGADTPESETKKTKRPPETKPEENRERSIERTPDEQSTEASEPQKDADRSTAESDDQTSSKDVKKERVRALLMKRFGEMKAELKETISGADPKAARALSQTAELFAKSMKDEDFQRAAKIQKVLQGAMEKVKSAGGPSSARPNRAPQEAADQSESAGVDGAKADDADGKTDIAAVVAAARKKPMNFAWMFGDGELILRAHKRLPVEKLVQNAKTAGAGSRGAWGRMDARGKRIILTCENDPPAKALVGRAKKEFKKQGVTFRVEFRAPSGTTVIDTDAAEAEGEAAADVIEFTLSPRKDRPSLGAEAQA